MYNDDEGAGGIYGFSDDEKDVENDNYFIMECKNDESVRDLRRKKWKAYLRATYKDKAREGGFRDGVYPSFMLDEYIK